MPHPDDLADHPSGTSDPTPAVVDAQQAFLELGRIDLTTTPLTAVLRRVAELARSAVPGAEEVSVTLLDGDQPRSVAFTGDVAVHLDERQYAQGFGPCMDAARSGTVVAVDDTAATDRYRDFGAAAQRAGVRSSLSVGLPVPRRSLGGLNLYARSTGAFDEESTQLARAFADYAAVVLANAALVDARQVLAGQLQDAMQSRAVIEQAKGILMGRLGCTADEAFQHLVRQSQHGNRKLRDVAVELVDRTAGPAGGA